MSLIIEAKANGDRGEESDGAEFLQEDQLPEQVGRYFRAERAPNSNREEAFDSIVLEGSLKKELLNYVLMLPSLRRIPRHRGGPSGFGLLFGPAGSGKSTAALGMANTFAGRSSIGSAKPALLLYALLGTWFGHLLGETSKSVSRAFEAVRLLALQRPIALVLDEIDSLAMSRKNLSEGDPTDVRRAVNTVLMELDLLAQSPNVLVIGTTNQEETIDSAVLDRADNVWRFTYPGARAARVILADTIQAYRSHSVALTEDLVSAIVDTAYAGNAETGLLSGRDLRRLFRLAIWQFGTVSLKPAHVQAITRELLTRRNGHAEH